MLVNLPVKFDDMNHNFAISINFVIFCAAYGADRLFSLVSEVILKFSIFFLYRSLVKHVLVVVELLWKPL